MSAQHEDDIACMAGTDSRIAERRPTKAIIIIYLII
jgi:hypothetical protein